MVKERDRLCIGALKMKEVSLALTLLMFNKTQEQERRSAPNVFQLSSSRSEARERERKAMYEIFTQGKHLFIFPDMMCCLLVPVPQNRPVFMETQLRRPIRDCDSL